MMFRRVTRHFLGQGSFLGIRAVRKHLPTTTRKNGPAGKNSLFFCLETLKNCILNEKYYPQMTTIRAFYPQIRALFSDFRKRARETSLPPPPPHPPLVTRLDVIQSQTALIEKLAFFNKQLLGFIISLISSCHWKTLLYLFAYERKDLKTRF